MNFVFTELASIMKYEGGFLLAPAVTIGDLLLVQNYDLFRRFDAHFVSGADLE